MFVVPGKKRKAPRKDVTDLLATYRAAKDTESSARHAAEEARNALIELAGDAEILVDKNGVQMVKLPERSRRTLPVVEALEIAPILESIIKVSHYRVVTR